MKLRWMGNRTLSLSRISLGNWLFMLKFVLFLPPAPWNVWIWPQYSGVKSPGSEVMDPVEGDVLHCVPWKLQVGLGEGFSGNFCFLFSRFWDAWQHQVISRAMGLEIDHLFFLNAVRDLTVSCSIAFSKDPLKKWNFRCRISTRDNLGWMLDNRILI